MLELITVSIAIIILFIAGAFLYKGRDVKPVIQKEEPKFETKYDELTYLYSKGEITEQKYKDEIKSIIN